MPISSPLVPHTWQLPEFFSQRLGKTVGRQRVFIEQGQVLIVTHQAPKTGERTRKGILFWRDDQGQWRASSGDHGVQAISKLLQSYEQQLDEYERLETKASQSSDFLALLDNLAPIARSIRNLSDVLQEARTAAPQYTELIDIRDHAYELARAADLLHQDTKNSMEVAVVRRSEEQSVNSLRMAQEAHRLNRLVAVFFPIATLATVFSTTLTENWSWSRTAGPFILLIIVGILSGVGLLKFVSRK